MMTNYLKKHIGFFEVDVEELDVYVLNYKQLSKKPGSKSIRAIFN